VSSNSSSSNNSNDIVSIRGDKIVIDIERMVNEIIYPCIYNDRVLLFIKDDEGNFNCYEIRDEELRESIRREPTHDNIVRLLNGIIVKEG
jgi:hypothetical protein